MLKGEQRKPLKPTFRIEGLEERQFMAGEPVSGLLGGAVQLHGIQDPPLFAHGSLAELDQGPPNGAISHHGGTLADFHLDYLDTVVGGPGQTGGDLQQHLASAHAQTGLISVRNDYGFRGTGQTVAIIDSGIAYDHYALGGGLGSGFRVVGGWDFTPENDSNPYDDGPGGSHGTHVAGIVGADNGTINGSGVASGVDFVGLRVFDDDGAGYFSWVENALQWVHQNRNAYANPITTVNLSLGTNWNADGPPGWAMLEDEFAQLKADGIFISVSAGNDFASYNQPGLSYPAASPYVVPVMSVDDNGSLSYFSQRHERAIAAPGRWIVSTVPDYVGNHNGVTDDWASFSGTSMAAPYLAGASVLVREALEFVGLTNITQDTIYDHIRATSDIFFDAATNANYHRLNLEAAIDALMPSDDYGSTLATAHSLGTVGGSTQLAGLVGTLSDVDFFSFEAGVTGTVTFTGQTTHNLAASWQVDGSSGTVSGNDGEVFSFDVVAGQTYTVGISTSDGIGYYDLSISVEQSINPIDWGTIVFAQHSAVDNSTGETWYQVQAGSAGYLTVEAFYDSGLGNVDLLLYDSQMNMLAESTTSGGNERVEASGTAGDMYYIRVMGSHSSVDFRLSNLVQVDGATIRVNGTAGNDNIQITLGGTHSLVVNDVSYSFDSQSVVSFDVQAGGGSDHIELTGTAADESAELRVGQLTFTSDSVVVIANSVEVIVVEGGGGVDTASLHDSASNDLLRTWSHRAILSGTGFYNRVDGFDSTFAYSTAGGYDEARMYDAPSDDLYRTWSDKVIMSGSGFYNRAEGFEYTRGFATSGGYDEVRMYDTPGNDLYRAWSNQVISNGNGYYNVAEGFEMTRGISMYGGYDEVRFYDTSGNDLFRMWKDLAVMSGNGFYNHAEGFDVVQGFASTGNDEAHFYDTPGNDLYRAYAGDAIMSGASYYHRAHAFDVTYAYATAGGYDEVRMYDSITNDLYRTWSDKVIMSGTGFYNRADGFELTLGYATSGGFDEVRMYDSIGNDLYRAWADKVIMSGSGFYNRADGFEYTRGFATSGGYDEVRFYDSVFDDLFRVWHNRAIMNGNGFYNMAEGFESQRGFASSGNDTARFYDSGAADHVIARDWGASLQGGAYYYQAVGFDSITADGNGGGNNTSDIDVVDYLFQLVGQWD